MTMPNSVVAITARLVPSLLGLAALVWAATTLPPFWMSAPVEGLARRVVTGEPFRSDVLTGAVSVFVQDPGLRPATASQAEAVVRIRIAERGLSSDAAVDARLAEAAAAVDGALAQAPSAAYLWLARYWLATARYGVDIDHLPDLVRSYRLAPREGWIAIPRHPLALAVFAELDPATQQRVVEEFAGLVSAQMIREAAGHLAGLGWPIRDRLLASLTEVDLAPKQALIKAMRAEGLRIELPGVPEQEERPWR